MFKSLKVKALLTERGFNVRTFAKKLKELNYKMSEQTLYRKINGDVDFTVTELEFICKFFGVEPASFF